MTVTAVTASPSTELLPACGFKEWTLVCDALGDGAQSIILRKGGIHEGRAGFFWKHDSFFLFPTRFHEQGTDFPRPDGRIPEGSADDDEPHPISVFGDVTWKVQITAREDLEKLRPFHFWSDRTIEDRFDYTDHAGISLAFLRVRKLDEPWIIPHLSRYGGCRSWLDLPEVPRNLVLRDVVSDHEHAARLAGLKAALSQP